MFRRKVYTVLAIAFLMQSISAAKAANVVERCVEGISRIRSYDVTYSLEDLAYPNPAEPDKANLPARIGTRNIRDVFAVGLGRRVEDLFGTDRQSIAVNDWTTAGSRGKLSALISYASRGNGYLDFFNPNCSGFFLADLLRDKESVVRMLEASSSPKGLIGFEVEHPQLRKPIQVWVDPDHGYMPSMIESFSVYESGQRTLYDRTQVKEFMQIGDGTWVPVMGTYEKLLRAGGLNTGKGYTGTSLVVDAKRSSWNSIVSDKLFTSASLPSVSLVREDGYKVYLPSTTLAELKQAKKSYDDALLQVMTEGKSSRLQLFLAINISLLILLIAILVWRRYRRHKAMAAG